VSISACGMSGCSSLVISVIYLSKWCRWQLSVATMGLPGNVFDIGFCFLCILGRK